MRFWIRVSPVPASAEQSKWLALPGRHWGENVFMTIYQASLLGPRHIIGPVRLSEVVYPFEKNIPQSEIHKYSTFLWELSPWGLSETWTIPPDVSEKFGPGEYVIRVILDTLSLPQKPQFIRVRVVKEEKFYVKEPVGDKEKSVVHYHRAEFYYSLYDESVLLSDQEQREYLRERLLRALKEAQTARSFFPSAPVHWIYAIYYEEEGKLREAVKELENYLQILPPPPPGALPGLLPGHYWWARRKLQELKARLTGEGD